MSQRFHRSFLDQFRVLLLDMNGTFMFGGDRFTDPEAYAATYRRLGGRTLSDDSVNRAIQACYDAMNLLYVDPALVDAFPRVIDTLRVLPETLGMVEADLRRLDRVFARHERGIVPPAYAAVLHDLAATHELGLVANIWAGKASWLEELDRAGVRSLFKTLVFSSDSASMKPSVRLFETALAAFEVDRHAVLFIGDSLRCDIEGAKATGLASLWIRGDQEAGGRRPDGVIGDLLEVKAVAT